MLTPERLAIVAANCGRHTSLGRQPLQGQRDRELWGLIEILDFQCDLYGDSPDGITGEEAREYLKAHKEEVLALEGEPTSYLGLFAGVLNFLTEQEVQHES